MRRFVKRKVSLFAILALGVTVYFLILLGSDLMSEAPFNADDHSGMRIMSIQSLATGFSSNIKHRSVPQTKQYGQHELIQERDDKVTDRVIKRWQLNHVLPQRNVEELGPTVVPNVVFYIWCSNQTFEYKHYLSVMSVWYHIEPDSLEIYYKYEPQQDKYNAWLELLKSTIANLVLTKMPESVKCDSCFNYVLDFLNDRGGIFISEETIVLNSLHEYRNSIVTAFFDDKDTPKLILSTRRRVFPACFVKSITVPDTTIKRCQKIEIVPPGFDTSDHNCVVLTKSFYPKDIFTGNDTMTANFREISYGDRGPVISVTSESRIPKIVHYIWYNPANMTFVMYLSVLSSLHVIKADRVYIHGGNSLQGHYWEKVKVNPRVQIVDRERVHEIFGNRILYTHHKSDVMRADILYKYGGIYVDWDVLWLKPIDDLISTGYDVIVNFDHMPRLPFPESINMGVVLSKPRAKYIDLWRKTYRNYRSNDFFYNPIEVPYKVYEMYPSLLRIEPRLQVMCFRLKCHPVFHPDFKAYDKSQPFDWTKDVYSIHFTYPDPEEYKSETALKNGHGMFSEIGQYILNASNH